jgi:hypothetical protein
MNVLFETVESTANFAVDVIFIIISQLRICSIRQSILTANDCMHAGGLFHFKKGHTAYSLDPKDLAFSRQLVAYIAGFLPVAMYFRNSDTRYAEIACRAQVHSSRPLSFRLEYQLCMVGIPAVLDLIAPICTPVQALSSGPTDFATGTPTPGLQASSTISTAKPSKSISCRRARMRCT